MKGKPEEGSTLCVLLTSSPESENSRTLRRVVEAALFLGHRVQIFLMCDGVYHILEKGFLSLVREGAEVTLCAENALERGLAEQEGVLFGSQYDLAVMVAGSEGFLALT